MLNSTLIFSFEDERNSFENLIRSVRRHFHLCRKNLKLIKNNKSKCYMIAKMQNYSTIFFPYRHIYIWSGRAWKVDHRYIFLFRFDSFLAKKSAKIHKWSKIVFLHEIHFLYRNCKILMLVFFSNLLKLLYSESAWKKMSGNRHSIRRNANRTKKFL